MLPKYTFALGGTDKIKKVVIEIEGAKDVIDRITKKYENKGKFKIG